jgi:hypothetical protein
MGSVSNRADRASPRWFGPSRTSSRLSLALSQVGLARMGALYGPLPSRPAGSTRPTERRSAAQSCQATGSAEGLGMGPAPGALRGGFVCRRRGAWVGARGRVGVLAVGGEAGGGERDGDGAGDGGRSSGSLGGEPAPQRGGWRMRRCRCHRVSGLGALQGSEGERGQQAAELDGRGHPAGLVVMHCVLRLG